MMKYLGIASNCIPKVERVDELHLWVSSGSGQEDCRTRVFSVGEKAFFHAEQI